MLTDSSVHAPLLSGPYHYNNFVPGSGGFPVKGGEFTDPVFGASDPTGSVIRRLTADDNTATAGELIYGHHWCNADGSSFLWQIPSSVHRVFSTVDGSQVSPGNVTLSTNKGDTSWHPTDSDKYFYFASAVLRQWTVSAGTSAAIHTFPATIQDMGQSLDFVDASGTKFVVRYSGAGHVYDSVEDVVYSGTTGVPTTGYLTITPDAKYAILAQSGAFTAYPLDHAANSVGTGFPFWSDSGDHAGVVSASNGNSYVVRQDGHASGDFKCYSIKIQDETGKTHAQMQADNNVIFDPTAVQEFHISGVGRGVWQDWCFIAVENASDTFNGGVSGWIAYESEILVVNVLTLEVRRLAHSRSRSYNTVYDYAPRVSCSWDGNFIIWASNFNDSTPSGYIDCWGVANPLGSQASTAGSWQGLGGIMLRG